ncbi:hypothetical protein D3C74_149800 [compost metagenome]
MNNELRELLQSVIREELKPVNEQLQELRTVQQEMKQDIQEIKEDQHLIKRAVLDTNERVMKMESVLENQHRIIELLSTRSIQQEAELKRIK